MSEPKIRWSWTGVEIPLMECRIIDAHSGEPLTPWIRGGSCTVPSGAVDKNISLEVREVQP